MTLPVHFKFLSMSIIDFEAKSTEFCLPKSTAK